MKLYRTIQQSKWPKVSFWLCLAFMLYHLTLSFGNLEHTTFDYSHWFFVGTLQGLPIIILLFTLFTALSMFSLMFSSSILYFMWSSFLVALYTLGLISGLLIQY